MSMFTRELDDILAVFRTVTNDLASFIEEKEASVQKLYIKAEAIKSSIDEHIQTTEKAKGVLAKIGALLG